MHISPMTLKAPALHFGNRVEFIGPGNADGNEQGQAVRVILSEANANCSRILVDVSSQITVQAGTKEEADAVRAAFEAAGFTSSDDSRFGKKYKNPEFPGGLSIGIDEPRKANKDWQVF